MLLIGATRNGGSRRFRRARRRRGRRGRWTAVALASGGGGGDSGGGSLRCFKVLVEDAYGCGLFALMRALVVAVAVCGCRLRDATSIGQQVRARAARARDNDPLAREFKKASTMSARARWLPPLAGAMHCKRDANLARVCRRPMLANDRLSANTRRARARARIFGSPLTPN